MANNYQMRLAAVLRTGGSVLQFARDLSKDQTGTGYDARVLAVQSDADGWTQYSKPGDMGDVRHIVIHNPSTNTVNVRVALTAATTYVTDDIPPGEFILKTNPAAAAIYLSHKGATGGTRDVEILAFES
jgi:hypothetical protein